MGERYIDFFLLLWSFHINKVFFRWVSYRNRTSCLPTSSQALDKAPKLELTAARQRALLWQFMSSASPVISTNIPMILLVRHKFPSIRNCAKLCRANTVYWQYNDFLSKRNYPNMNSIINKLGMVQIQIRIHTV